MRRSIAPGVRKGWIRASRIRTMLDYTVDVPSEPFSDHQKPERACSLSSACARNSNDFPFSAFVLARKSLLNTCFFPVLSG